MIPKPTLGYIIIVMVKILLIRTGRAICLIHSTKTSSANDGLVNLHAGGAAIGAAQK
jgi:hypothetical protein